MSTVMSILYILIGFALLIKGADILVDGASTIAKKFHIPELVIGLTVVSIGTSMPELFISIKSAYSGHPDIAIGNVIGSNISNLLLILGLSSLIRPIAFKKETRFIELPMCLIITVVFYLICNAGENVTRQDAAVLITLFVLFVLYTIIMTFAGEKFDKEDINSEIDDSNDKKKSTMMSLLNIIVGIIALKYGGDFVVDNATVIAEKLGWSEKLISVTIIAIGTSLPELVTSVSAAIKNESDISIGNILGSNIFNMLLIVGVAASIKPINYNVDYNMDMNLMILASAVLVIFPFVPPKNKISRRNGLLYLILYGVYMFRLFV